MMCYNGKKEKAVFCVSRGRDGVLLEPIWWHEHLSCT